MMALLAGDYHTLDPEPLHRAAVFLMRAQQGSGDWPQQHISGVFNRNCMITYANYRYVQMAYTSSSCFYAIVIIQGAMADTNHCSVVPDCMITDVRYK